MEPIKCECVTEERVSKKNETYFVVHISFPNTKFKLNKFLTDTEFEYLNYLASNTTNGKPQSVEEPSVSPYDFES